MKTEDLMYSSPKSRSDDMKGEQTFALERRQVSDVEDWRQSNTEETQEEREWKKRPRQNVSTVKRQMTPNLQERVLPDSWDGDTSDASNS